VAAVFAVGAGSELPALAAEALDALLDAVTGGNVKLGELGELGPNSLFTLNATTITRAVEPTLPVNVARGWETSSSRLKSASSRWT
jgi:hypothetical protein